MLTKSKSKIEVIKQNKDIVLFIFIFALLFYMFGFMSAVFIQNDTPSAIIIEKRDTNL